jgi:4-alpha-glucanotransferase
MDSWNDLGAVENIFSTEPFKNVLLRTELEGRQRPSRLSAPRIGSMSKRRCCRRARRSACWAAPAPGRLEPSRAGLAARDAENGCFRVQLDLAKETFPVAYKYGVYDLERNAFVRYEDGANRVLAEAAPRAGR